MNSPVRFARWASGRGATRWMWPLGGSTSVENVGACVESWTWYHGTLAATVHCLDGLAAWRTIAGFGQRRWR